MGKLKDKIKEIFYDEEELELLNTRIADLYDLCDSKDMTIRYQKELIEVQKDTIKEFRRTNEELMKIKEELNNVKSKKNTKRESA